MAFEIITKAMVRAGKSAFVFPTGALGLDHHLISKACRHSQRPDAGDVEPEDARWVFDFRDSEDRP